MWGNKIGWGISAAIVIVTIGMLVMFEMSNSPSEPTAAFKADAKNLEEIHFDPNPKTVVAMDDDCDAGDFYKEAIADVEAHQDAYDQFTTAPRDLSDLANLNGVESVVKATHCKRITLMSRTPEKYISAKYESDISDLDALKLAGRAAVNAGLLAEQAGNNADAFKYYNAAFAMGAKMTDERLMYVELLAGIDLMKQAAKQIEDLANKAGDKAREQVVGDFRKAFDSYVTDHILTTARIVTSIDPGVVEEHAGDVFLLARDSKDHMWKSEAVLKLGRYKYYAGRAADNRQALRAVRQMANDPALDPVTKLAAAAARDLTEDDYNRLH